MIFIFPHALEQRDLEKIVETYEDFKNDDTPKEINFEVKKVIP